MPIEADEVKALIAEALKTANEAFVGELKGALASQAKAHKADLEATKAELEALKAAGASGADEGAGDEDKPAGKGRKVVGKDDVAQSQQLAALKAELEATKAARQAAEERAASVAKRTALAEQFARVGIQSPTLRAAAESLLRDKVVSEDGAFFVERTNRFGTKEAMTLEAFIDEWSAGEGQEFLPVRQSTAEAGPAGVRRPGVQKPATLEELKAAGAKATERMGGFNIG